MNYSKNILLSRDHRTRVCFRVVFADGSSYQNCAGTPEATIIFRNRWAEWNALLFGHVGLMEAYSACDIDIEGSLPLALRAGLDMTLDKKPNPLVSLRNRWHEFRFSNKTSISAASGAPTSMPARRCSAPPTPARICSRSPSARATSRTIIR
ncbi:MAG: hypothetical protein O2845_04950 [Proteobacteria bacterium]|nr:hypothetical protein [Pseudomonadota bacterium]